LSYICYASVIYIWPTYAKRERGWSESELGNKIVIAFAIGMLGYIISGLLMDILGRRVTSVVFFIGSAITLILAFTVHQPYIIPAIAAAMFFIFALLPICSTFNSELFPTDVRASATAWSNYLLGRPAQVFAPFVIGSIGGFMGGIGPAARLMAVGPAIAIFIVIFFIPETKGVNLDKVH
jgi:MFS family permease